MQQIEIPVLTNQEYAHRLARSVDNIRESEGRLPHWQGISIRDTAHLVRLNPGFLGDEKRNLLFSNLIESQNSDGSWGDSRITSHPALIDTLEMVRLLIDDPNNDQYQTLIADGWGATAKLLARSSADIQPKHETVALELLAPPLIEYIALRLENKENDEQAHTPEFRTSLAYNLLLASSDDDKAAKYYLRLKKDQAKKIELMKGLSPGHDRIFSPGTTAAHAYEAAGTMYKIGALNIDSPDITGAAEYRTTELAGVALSPAATAEAILLLKELGQEVPEEYYRYLELAYTAHDEKGVPGVFPFRNTDALWVAINPLLADDIEALSEERLLTAYEKYLKQIKNENGISWDDAQNIPDLDDTVLALIYTELLKSKGREVREDLNYKLLYNFIENGMFVCYKGEMTPSPSHVYHTLFYLDKLRQQTHPPEDALEINRLYEMALTQIRDVISGDEFSAADDKWIAGEAYTFYRMINSVLLEERPELIKIMLKRTQRLQLGDGGFGTHLYKNSLIDETGHVYLSLNSFLNRVNADSRLQNIYADILPLAEQVIDSTQNHLYQRMVLDNDWGWEDPPIWFAKGTYKSYMMHEALCNSVMSVMFRRINEAEFPLKAKAYQEVKLPKSIVEKLIENSHSLWDSVVKLSQGERDYSYLRNARAIGGIMFEGLDLDIAAAMPPTSDPPVFNKVMEALAEMKSIFPGMDKKYTQVILQAADPRAWKIILEADTKSDNPIEYVMKITARHIALIGLHGRDVLKNDEYLPDWQELYQLALIKNYQQELDKGRIDTSEVDYGALEQSATEIVGDFLDKFGATSAIGVAIIGAIAHRRGGLSQELVDFLASEDFDLIVKTSRLVQDINQVDPTERINTGIWLLSRINCISIDEAKKLAAKGYAIDALRQFSIKGKDTHRHDVREFLREIYENEYLAQLKQRQDYYQNLGTQEGEYIAKLIAKTIEVNDLVLMFKEQGELV